MATRATISRVDRFAGWSDRAIPVQLSRIESPDLMNAEFTDRALRKRRGFERLTTEPLRTSSFSLNGINTHLRFEHISAYAVSSLSVGITTRIREFPDAERTLLSKGFGTSSDRYCQISYDPTINSGAGGWRLRIYDTSGAALRNVTVNDGDSAQSQVGLNRHLALWESAAGTYTFQVWEADGTSVGSTTASVGGLVSTTDDWILGCDTADGTTIPADGASSFFLGLASEFRLGAAAGATAVQAVDRELRDDEYDDLVGYWRLNDGQGSEVADLSQGSNPGVGGAAGPQWVGSAGGAVGSSALRFRGERGHVRVDCSGWVSEFFTDTASGYRRWSIHLVFRPELAQGEVSVRDQTLLWFGEDSTGTANPEPLGIQVVSNNIVCKYVDGSGLNTLTNPFNVTNAAGVSLRIAVTYSDLSSNESLQLTVITDTFSGGINVADTSVTGNPSTFATDLSIGRRLQSFALPQTFQSKSAFGTIDDIAFIKDYDPSNGPNPMSATSLPTGQQFSDLDSIPGRPSASLILGVPLDDGGGDTPVTRGSNVSDASIFPQQAGQLEWGEGLVEPECPEEITLLTDYRRLAPTGETLRSILAISGTTLYEISPSTGAAQAVAGNLIKGGVWTAVQYASSIYLAAPNGQRPVVYNGSSLTFVGIVAPNIGPTIASDTVSGSVGAGTYHVYVTFRNSSTGVESNPSPVTSFTLASSGRVTQIDLPVSPDPQVNQRRIWVTQPNGGAGSTAVPWVTIDDNATTSYTTTITAAVPTIGAVTLDYVNNEEAPAGSLVAVHRDRLLVAGSTEFPTRMWYSAPGELESFNHTTGFEDADLDAGDPIVGIISLRDQIVVYLRDGRVGYTATGATSPVYTRTDLNRDTGAVAHNAIHVAENRHIFVGERDIFLWDGSDVDNLTSPPEATRPSIKYFIRETIDDARKSKIDMAFYRSLDQIWFTVSTNGADRNDRVIVLDWSQAIWSLYDLQLDRIEEIEDEADEPRLYGASQGHIIKLDTGVTDGPSTSGTATSGTTTSVVDSAASWTVDAYKGIHVHVRDASGEVTERRIVKRNDATTLYLDAALSFTPASGDAYVVGGIPWWADFIADNGNPMELKRIRWVKVAGFNETDSVLPDFRVYLQADVQGRAWSFTPMSSTQTWSSTDNIRDFLFGGLCRSARVRLTDTQFDGDASVGLPQLADTVTVSEFQVEMEAVSAR